ncbi:MAG TPA: tRNA 2-thiocytidine biosynthesis protein TtcA [Firmicutes bacterium]|nr:tRNA 2-thiocytidine biosynthesis protein TtcA [Bacillota bacterium]
MRRSDRKWFLTRVKRTIYGFKMIENGDRVAVGLSGGKDSAALLYILNLFRRHAPFDFDLQGIFVHPGWPVDIGPLQAMADKLGTPLHVEETVIARVVFERRQEKNPCALCANMRRGALHKAALDLGCNKVALGHHLDDAVQTFMMNLIYTGCMGTFKPKTFLDRTGLYLIRPLIQLPENTLTALACRENLPLLKNPCPISGRTKRREMAELFAQLGSRYPDLREKWRSALLGSPFWQPQKQDFNSSK